MGGRSPPGISASTPVIQKGLDATTTAAMPLGTHCSAQITPPLPRQIMRNPSSASAGQCFGEGNP